MKNKKVNALIIACVAAANVCASIYAEGKIEIATQGAQVTVNLDNIQWAGKEVSVFIYSKSDENNDPIDFSTITNDIFSNVVVYADEFMTDENGKAGFAYLMRDDDISGDYCVNVSLTNGEYEETAEYFYASADERREFIEEIGRALKNKDTDALSEIFKRSDKDEKILESCGFLIGGYKSLPDGKKSDVLERMTELYTDDEVEAFNEAVIVQTVNDSSNIEEVFEQYSSYIGDMLFDNKNYQELKQNNKDSVLLEVLSNIEFDSFEDIQENILIQSALTLVNVQESYANIYDKLQKNNDIFELSMTDYLSLSDYYKSVVMKKMTSQNFKTVDDLKTDFNNAVRDALSDQNESSNSSSSGSNTGSGNGGRGNAIVQGDIINAVISQNKDQQDTTDQTIKDDVPMFDDIDGVEWAKEAIEKLCEAKVISGTGDGKFEPDREVTREEFVKMLVIAMGLEITEETTQFEDVVSDSWYEEYIKTAVENGIVSGISEYEFGIGKKITRQDMAVMIFRALNLDNSEDNNDKFADDADISDYAKDAVYAVKRAGIISGVGDNMFLPKTYATRAQAAKMIYVGIKQ